MPSTFAEAYVQTCSYSKLDISLIEFGGLNVDGYTLIIHRGTDESRYLRFELVRNRLLGVEILQLIGQPLAHHCGIRLESSSSSILDKRNLVKDIIIVVIQSLRQ